MITMTKRAAAGVAPPNFIWCILYLPYGILNGYVTVTLVFALALNSRRRKRRRRRHFLRQAREHWRELHREQDDV